MRTVLLSLVFVVACGGPTEDEPIVIDFDAPGETTTNNTADQPAELTGSELYAANCETCHGPEAAGGSTWKGSIRGLKNIAPIVRDGRGTMAAVALEDGDIAKIQGYLDSFGVVQAELSGREIFENRCATCHGDRGEGTALSFPVQFMHPELSEWVIRNGRSTVRFAGPMPSYSSDEISDEQLTEMVDYMWAQPLPSGGEGLYTAFCGNCHGEGGRGGYAGHLVARHDPTAIVRNGHGGSQYEARSHYMPSWTSSQISDVQLNNIRDYLFSL